MREDADLLGEDDGDLDQEEDSIHKEIKEDPGMIGETSMREKVRKHKSTDPNDERMYFQKLSHCAKLQL